MNRSYGDGPGIKKNSVETAEPAVKDNDFAEEELLDEIELEAISGGVTPLLPPRP